MTDDTALDSLSNPPSNDERFKPADLHLDREHGLKIEWADGETSRYPLPYLRQRCPCATCRTEREEARPTGDGLSLNILPANIDKAAEFIGARLVGHYAIQIDWADGHSTGLYDFRYLRMISPSP